MSRLFSHTYSWRKISSVGSALAALLTTASLHAATTLEPSTAGSASSAHCTSLIGTSSIEGAKITSAQVSGAGQGGEHDAVLPPHCDLFGIMHERVAADGQHYAIRFHMRLPDTWNGRFFFQGGGGTNGEVGDALGRISSGREAQAFPTALLRGYAVVSQDSGHDNRLNYDPKRGGVMVFGFDPQARADYGHASLAPVARVAKAIITAYYGKPIARSYFVGCSKGGEEGMVFAQQHPDMFDGIVANSPGFALPRAAVEQTFETKIFAGLIKSESATPIPFPALHNTFSTPDLKLVSHSILEACDALDGLKDGIVGNFAQCTTARVKPLLAKAMCSGAKNDSCLSHDQVTALLKIMAGARTTAGKQVYANWVWDAGIGTDGWRAWKLGSADGKIPALNVMTGSSLPAVFSVPPTALQSNPQTILDWQMTYNIDRDARQIYATDKNYAHSAWQDVSAHSPDLTGFKAHGGKLLVTHGVSDPVFSINDTINWYGQVNQRNHGHASNFVRVFPVPGMAHCGGGIATSSYDSFQALVDWVERGKAPDQIIATAPNDTPWPKRTRPLCAFPRQAHYKGTGSIDEAENFSCS